MSGWNRPDENTLGVILGRRRRGGVPTGSIAARAVVQAGAQGASLGTGHLGIGAGIICTIGAVYGVAVFASHISDYRSVIPAVIAWLIFVAAFATVSFTVATRGEHFSGVMFGGYLAALAAVVTLDFIAIWPLENIGEYASASLSAGFGLLVVVTLRPAREIVAASSALFATFATAILITTPLTAQTIPSQVLVLLMVTVPGLIGVFAVRRFRRMVQLELDRVLVQSIISAPRFAVGMLASEELARLDLAAEELLDSVASGSTALPLRPKTASTAASLATELRLHLLEGRRETWLYHAITESEQLGTSATLKDPGGLAGLLDPNQRDGLLAAVWLLVSDPKKTDPKKKTKRVGATAQVHVGPVAAPSSLASRKTITVPFAITTTGVSRGRVDTSVWEAFTKVGLFTTSLEKSSLRVDIECIVANPADQ